MENPFHTRVGTMVRNISNKFNEYEAVVEERLTKTQTRVKDKLTNNKKSPNGEFISRGAFGKVYKGTYNGQLVAVKTMSDVDTFVKEVKMACTMSHPNIVQFIEYMDGGDLRGLLDKYEEENRRTGFDAAKITIALHVAHALAYLHSQVEEYLAERSAGCEVDGLWCLTGTSGPNDDCRCGYITLDGSGGDDGQRVR
ncbi:hypothetical protein JG688_00005671 [Phytophthora aleatoria]|uniref:Protein kinase domain-containing protein n=1 Tax=Phytophthora aleatoria TaxID=2496075 RepID=A0A8J5M8F2_9STRA|nr:hypothetical protein JG688_00005671 [Phytophthora aleatoria]